MTQTRRAGIMAKKQADKPQDKKQGITAAKKGEPQPRKQGVKNLLIVGAKKENLAAQRAYNRIFAAFVKACGNRGHLKIVAKILTFAILSVYE